MAAGILPVSDPRLLADIRRYGKFDTAACYQCGSCTLSCDLVGDSATFPRRTIRYVLLGLRQPLVASLEPWVCHDCGDCSVVCPRQANPRISMMTIRRFLSAQYDWTGLGAKLYQSDAWYVGSLVFVALLTIALIIGYHLWYLKMATGDFASNSMQLGLEHMFPRMTYYTLAVILLPFLLLLSRVIQIWRLTMGGDQRMYIPLSAYFAEWWTYAYQSVTHAMLRKCPQKGRWLGHWLLAFGTVTMLVVKTFGLRWFQTDNIYALYNPQRWVGYLAAGCILYGIADISRGRWHAKKEFYKETHFHDVVFPVLIVLTVLSGLAAHILRYAGFALACHYAYALHVIIATPMLVIEMSFGKWSHMVYRPLALYFLAVRERAAHQVPAGEAVPNAI